MPPPVNVYVGSPEAEDALVQELTTKRRHPRPVAPGCVTLSAQLQTDPVFARHVLADAQRIEGRGRDDLAQALFAQLGEHEDAVLAGATRLAVFSPPAARPPRGQKPRSPLLGSARDLAAVLEQKRAGRARKRATDPAPPDGSRIDVLLVAEGAAYVTAPFTPDPDPMLAWPSAFPGGHAEVADLPAPSSAYRKLVEALRWLGDPLRPGDRAVDLGGAPGGWSYVLLEHGARVVAYDRGDMDPGLLARPGFEHRRKDAFVHADFTDVDVVVCDIIDEPKRIVSLLKKALPAAPRVVVFTIKLKAPLEAAKVRAIKDALAGDHAYQLRVKHLVHNKTEVTVMMRRR